MTHQVLGVDLGVPSFEIRLVGTPGPQGSKKAFARGKRILVIESSAKVKPWREAVATAARVAVGRDWEVLDGPLVGAIVLTLKKPKSAPKTLRVLPTTYPDVSKLLRSTEDALGTDAGIIRDDARIVEYARLAKVYEGDALDPDALPTPGAVIRLWKYPETLLGKTA